MANTSALLGDCIPPFMDAAMFPREGGCKSISRPSVWSLLTNLTLVVSGRLCAPIDALPGQPTCCLPCPTADWVYLDSFSTYNQVAEWLNVVGLILMVFMLISYSVLPAQKTRSHYLSVCLVVAVVMITLGFTIPLATRPEQCFNEITPNDMYSSMTCAWSGAFIIAGGMCAAMWVLIRALSMNLQICFDIVPGRKFFYASQAVGWGVPGVLFTATMTVTGVSFRFGSQCHVNHKNSMAAFWGPLLAIAGIAGLLQLVTLSYCIHVYLKNLWNDQPPTSTTGAGSTSELPTYTNSVRTQTARAVYRRLKKVLWLQWRGICIVSIILVDVVFFSIVFVYLDGQENALSEDIERIQPWIMCLALNPADKDQCVDLIQGWLVNEPTVVAVLLLLSFAGFQVFLFMARPSIVGAWKDFFQTRFGRRQEFVSLDAARPTVMRSNSKQELLRYQRGHQSTTFEMQQPGSRPQKLPAHVPGFNWDTKEFMSSPTQTVLSTPDETYRSPIIRTHYSPDFSAEKSDSSDSTNNILNRTRFVAQKTPELYPPTSPSATRTTRATSPPLGTTTTITSATGTTTSTTSQPDYFSRTPSSTSRRSPNPHRNTSSASQQGRSSPSDHRRYIPPQNSFAQPRTPSRQNSLRSTTWEVGGQAGPGGVFAPGGLGLNPPSEVGEVGEDEERRGR